MTRLGSLLSVTVALLVLGERPVAAYVDPGSASYVFQIIVGAMLGGVFLLRTYWNRVVTTIRSLVRRDVVRHE